MSKLIIDNMQKQIHFIKMHGLGNDFIILDTIKQAIKIDPVLMQRLAHRQKGIGCDQVLIVEPPQDPESDFHYRIFNADGKEAAQCGNGARCFGRYVLEQGLTTKSSINVSSLGGNLKIDLTDTQWIKVFFPLPNFEPAAIGLNVDKITKLEPIGRYQIPNSPIQREVMIFSLGNPHCVIPVSNIYEAPVEAIGTQLQRHGAFLNGVNVSFMQVLAKNHIKCRVFERGVGETLACGTAALACAIAGIMRQELNEEVKVDMPGGSLTILWQGEELQLSGPTTTVFKGEFCLEEIMDETNHKTWRERQPH